jgi:two-component system chemotaxis response regulator CheY
MNRKRFTRRSVKPGLPSPGNSSSAPNDSRCSRQRDRCLRGSSHLPSRTVLAVDDEASVLEIYRKFLSDVPGVRVLTTTKSSEALRILATTPVDLVVSDYNRPHMTGLEFTLRVRKMYPGVPMLLFSGAYSENLRTAAEIAGATVCLPKPFRMRQFVRLVRRFLVRRQRRKPRR